MLPMPRYIFLLFLLPASVLAQDMSNFALFGSAQRLNDECFLLTEDAHYQNGSIQYGTPIDLRQPFEMEMDVFLGCNDALGADGIVFIFYTGNEQLGYRGEGMGFGGLYPSLGIELDTYCNNHLGDPIEDHATVMLHGRVGHWASSARPVTLLNLEDCSYHPMEINWDPTEQVLEVLLDNRRIYAYKANLVKDVFMGESSVYWGVSAATANKRNRQEVCFRKLKLGEVLDTKGGKRTFSLDHNSVLDRL